MGEENQSRRTFLATSSLATLSLSGCVLTDPIEPVEKSGGSGPQTITRRAASSTTSQDDAETARTTEEADGAFGPHASWPMFQYDPGNTGYNPDASAPSSGSEVWQVGLPGQAFTAPAVANARAYLSVFDTETGEGPLAVVDADPSYPDSFEFEDRVLNTPAIRGDRMYFHRYPAVLECVTEGTTSVEWSYEMEDQLANTCTVTEDDTVIGAQSDVGDDRETGRVFAVDGASGDRIWHTDLDGRIDSLPAVTDELVLCIAAETLFALDRNDGTKQWSVADPSGIGWISPSVANDVVVVGATQYGVQGLDPVTGESKWRMTVSGRVGGYCATPNNHVFVYYDRGMVALDLHTGEQLWVTRLPGEAASVPTVADGQVHVGNDMGDVHAIDTANGDIAWEYQGSEIVANSIPIVDDVALVVTQDGVLTALE
jgi:outer membrane protein assembly factor BamB